MLAARGTLDNTIATRSQGLVLAVARPGAWWTVNWCSPAVATSI